MILPYQKCTGPNISAIDNVVMQSNISKINHFGKETGDGLPKIFPQLPSLIAGRSYWQQKQAQQERLKIAPASSRLDQPETRVPDWRFARGQMAKLAHTSLSALAMHLQNAQKYCASNSLMPSLYRLSLLQRWRDLGYRSNLLGFFVVLIPSSLALETLLGYSEKLIG